jgi:precorrin-6Y C5,15-methyltransferase (decarboxylating)
MSRPVRILGIGADGVPGLPARTRDEIAAATFLAGGRRHLEMVGETRAETFVVTNNLPELADRLAQRGEDERCVVLASGDPMFFGIGHFLGERLGRDQISAEPTVSSMQLAFARAGLPWHDATVASIHGRPFESSLLPLLGRPKIGLFTRDGDDPSRVARFFADRGLRDYLAWVGEDLGSADERVTSLPIEELLGRRFRDLNVLLLLRTSSPDLTGLPPAGIPDDAFAGPDSGPLLLTHADVRAVTLARFRDLPDGPIWDLGAGLGGVAVELSRAFPAREVVAVERDARRLDDLRANRSRLEAHNMRVVSGEAPEVLSGEAPPAAVFLGGSGGRLDDILDLVTSRVVAGGVFVGNFVGLENLTACLARLKAAGWPTELTQVQISRGTPLAGLTSLVPLRPVWIVRASRAVFSGL